MLPGGLTWIKAVTADVRFYQSLLPDREMSWPHHSDPLLRAIGGMAVKTSEIMSREVSAVSPANSIKSAADIMRVNNVGILPVVDGNRMVGIITDRDIVLRVISDGKAVADSVVEDAMTEEVHYCLDDDDVEDVAKRLGELRIRRMPVLDSSGHIVGMISLDDVAVHADWARTVTEALRSIALPSRSPR